MVILLIVAHDCHKTKDSLRTLCFLLHKSKVLSAFAESSDPTMTIVDRASLFFDLYSNLKIGNAAFMVYYCVVCKKEACDPDKTRGWI